MYLEMTFFEKLNIEIKNKNKNFSLHIGGPLSQNNGFILHSKEYKEKDTIKITQSSKTLLVLQK